MSASPRSLLEELRVLILEDEFFLADDLARALRGAGARPVGPVSTVRQAQELISREQVDAAILDLNLHGEMAFEFVERLAATKLPCLIISGYAADAVPEALSRVPRLEKPVSPSAVIERLSAELAQTA